jgi:peptidoglycan/xylan/chitin deacetylase (PgdA/CDA1 family)
MNVVRNRRGPASVTNLGRTFAATALVVVVAACGLPGSAESSWLAAARQVPAPRQEVGSLRLGRGVTAISLAADPLTGGYWVLTSSGRVGAFGAPWLGSLAGHIPPGVAVISIAASTDGGYFILTSNGGVHAFGTAWHGSDAGKLRPGVRAVSLAADPLTGGYWILTSAGRVDAFHAPRLGSLARKIPVGGAVTAIAAGKPGGYLIMTSSGGPVPARLAGRVWNVLPTRRRVVALTFDIGPHNGVASILATLRRDHVPATFFLVGGTVKKFPAMARSIAAAGERVADHSNRHPHFTRVLPARMRSEVVSAEAEVRKVTGLDPWPWFRFPYGDYDARAIKAVNAAGFVPIGWTVDTLGWEGTSHGITAQIVVHRVLASRRPGEIVLMHGGSDSGDHSAVDAQALPTVIRKLRAYGYSFVSIDALSGFGARARAANGRVTAFRTPGHGSDAGKLRPGVTAVGLAADPASGGYWILTSTGRVDPFGAPELGSLIGKIPPGAVVTAIAAARNGYLILTSTGQVYSFAAG